MHGCVQSFKITLMISYRKPNYVNLSYFYKGWLIRFISFGTYSGYLRFTFLIYTNGEASVILKSTRELVY